MKSATHDRRLIRALRFIQEYRTARRDHLPYEINLGFLSRRWRGYVEERSDSSGEVPLTRRELEVCVMSYVATTKIESYNAFTDWLSFGGDVIRSGDPVEQEKRVKYRDLVANAVMLRNVADLTDVLAELREEGHKFTPEQAAKLSPYMTALSSASGSTSWTWRARRRRLSRNRWS